MNVAPLHAFADFRKLQNMNIRYMYMTLIDQLCNIHNVIGELTRDLIQSIWDLQFLTALIHFLNSNLTFALLLIQVLGRLCDLH